MRIMTFITFWAIIQTIFYPHYAYAIGSQAAPPDVFTARIYPIYSIQNGIVQSTELPGNGSHIIVQGQYLISAHPSIEIKGEEATTAADMNQGRKWRSPPRRRTFSRVVAVTAYSSTPDQTDSTPFITASGSRVHDGTVAANFLPIGTRVRFPDMYGDKIFVVEDRMARRFSYRMDIWFSNRYSAIQFGKRWLRVETLGS